MNIPEVYGNAFLNFWWEWSFFCHLFGGGHMSNPKYLQKLEDSQGCEAVPTSAPKMGILANGNFSGPETHGTTTQVGPSNYPDSQGLGETEKLSSAGERHSCCISNEVHLLRSRRFLTFKWNGTH